MLMQMIAIEQREITRRALFWFEWGLLVLILLAFFALIFSTRAALINGLDVSGDNGGLVITGIDEALATDLLTWPMGLLPAFSVINGVGGFLLIILSGAIMAQEYNWRSLQLWLTRGMPRPLFLLAKFTTITAVALLFTLSLATIGGVTSATFSRVFLGTLPATEIEWGRLLLHLLVTVYSIMPLVALTFLLAVASRSTVVAIGGGLGYAALIEPLLLGLLPLLGYRWGAIANYLPGSLAKVLRATSQAFTGDSPVAAGTFTPAGAALLLCLHIVVLLLTTMFIFQKQDLGG